MKTLILFPLRCSCSRCPCDLGCCHLAIWAFAPFLIDILDINFIVNLLINYLGTTCHCCGNEQYVTGDWNEKNSKIPSKYT